MTILTDDQLQRLLDEIGQVEIGYEDVMHQFDQRANDIGVATELFTKSSGDVDQAEVDALLGMYQDLDDLEKKVATTSQQLDKELNERINALKGPVLTDVELNARLVALRGPVPMDDALNARVDALSSSVEENAVIYAQHALSELKRFERESKTLISNYQSMRDTDSNRRTIEKLSQKLQAIQMAIKTHNNQPKRQVPKKSKLNLAKRVHQAAVDLQSRAAVVDACFGHKNDSVYTRYLSKIDKRADSNPNEAAQALLSFKKQLEQKESIIEQAKQVTPKLAMDDTTSKPKQQLKQQTQKWRSGARPSQVQQQRQTAHVAKIVSHAAREGASPGFLAVLAKAFNRACKMLFGSSYDKSSNSTPPKIS